MFTIWLIFHVIVCIALVVVVLMQSSKGEGLTGTAFGGGGGLSGAVFGGRGAASFLSKATTVLAILFMLNSAALAFMSAGGHITRQAGAQNQQQLPSQTESVITREAQKERERQMQQQQQQQQQAQPSDSTLNINVLPNEAKPKKDSAGK